jgi:hypothetical protein
MKRTARAAVLAAASLALVSMAPVVSAAPASASTPATEVRQSAPAFKVTASINRTEVVAEEDSVRITGRVRPRAVGQKVVLQQRKDGTARWVRTGTARAKPSGRFVLTDDPSTAGTRFYRVLKPAADGVRTGTSRELRLDVWGWELLTWRSVGANSGVNIGWSTSFGSVAYDASLVQRTAGTAGYVEYTLGKKCRSLRAAYALTDDSTTGASGWTTLSVDGTPVVTHALTTGSLAANQVVDVTNVFRIRFDLSSTALPAGRAAVGMPEVLCLP